LPSCGDSSTPATPARHEPIAHAARLIRDGRPPLSISRLRSSTVARIVTPRRVRNSSTYSTTATSAAVTTPMIWW
jgi:hypothetical protein